MKANEAPEKIYLQVCGDCPQTDCDNCKFETLEDNITWCKDRIFPKDIEYIRTDAFIDKAVKYVANHFLAPGMDNEIKDFVNYMKRE